LLEQSFAEHPNPRHNGSPIPRMGVFSKCRKMDDVNPRIWVWLSFGTELKFRSVDQVKLMFASETLLRLRAWAGWESNQSNGADDPLIDTNDSP